MVSAASRRTARRRARTLREQRRSEVLARHTERVNRWRAEQPDGALDAFGLAPGVPRMTRREREALHYPAPSTKQARKHLDKTLARLFARREMRRAALEAALAPLVAASGLALLRLEHLGGYCPLTAHGVVREPRGQELTFAFRFRYDRAFLEIGHPDPDEPSLVGDAILVASRDDVTGEPYASVLADRAVLQLLEALFAGAHAPVTGERFGERFANTLDLALGRGGDPDLPTLAR